MSQGVLQGLSILCAQSPDKAAAAGFLLAIRIQTALVGIANAPFYTKLPTLARWWSEGKLLQLSTVAERAMRLSLGSFVVPVIALQLLGPTFFESIHSKTPFPSPMLWWTLGLALLTERVGAMHLQVYSTTNHIIWHIANGGAGIIALALYALLSPSRGLMAIPIALLGGYSLFYTPISIYVALKTFPLLRVWKHAAFCAGIVLIYLLQGLFIRQEP
jgi:hypothetical protein